ncbi:MAG TPA: hypothetical protein VMF61_08370 [Candidatus Acidoferrales bacterium]|nr:hypothetical protein [Candidatus Acidoferrales bacterium]
MRIGRRLFALAVAGLLAACSFQNKDERLAENITKAMMNNDLRPVQNDIAPGIQISRVQVAEAADELDAQGRLLSVKETPQNCQPGIHCFDVKFERRSYVERMRLDENGKVLAWTYRPVAASP